LVKIENNHKWFAEFIIEEIYYNHGQKNVVNECNEGDYHPLLPNKHGTSYLNPLKMDETRE